MAGRGPRGRVDDEERDEDEVHLRDRRCRVVARQGRRLRLDRRAARGARSQGHAREDGPVHKRRPGNDEPVPARRGLRHRRRRRDRPRSRTLRALRVDAHQPPEQLHHRRRLPHRDREGAARGLSRRDRAGDPAHHRRDQAAHPRGRRGLQRLHLRGRGNSRRHREPALHRGHPPARLGRGARECPLRPPDAGAVHLVSRRAQDQAHPAQREGAHRIRDPAGHLAVPPRSRSRRR